MKRRTRPLSSSGKDSTWTLRALPQRPDVVGLLCTFMQAIKRVAMHGVRVQPARQQVGKSPFHPADNHPAPLQQRREMLPSNRV